MYIYVCMKEQAGLIKDANLHTKLHITMTFETTETQCNKICHTSPKAAIFKVKMFTCYTEYW